MSNLLIVPPYPLTTTQSGGVSISGVANLATPNPKEIASDASGTLSNIAVDLGAAYMVDSLFLGFTSGIATLATRGGLTGINDTDIATATTNPAPSAATTPRTQHFFRKLATPVAAQYLRFQIAPVASATMTAGIVAVGLAWQGTWGHEWGAGRRPIDTGSKDRLLSGAFGVNPGAVASSWQWTLGNLTDADRHALFEVIMGLGETKSLTCIEDPDATTGLNERIHWGMFVGLEAYEREFLGSSRWGFKLEDWA